MPPFDEPDKLASKPLAQPAPTIIEEVAYNVTPPVTPLLLNGVRLALIVPVRCVRIPHATRPPALLWIMKVLPSIALKLVSTEKMNEAQPVALVLLYRTLAHKSST